MDYERTPDLPARLVKTTARKPRTPVERELATAYGELVRYVHAAMLGLPERRRPVFPERLPLPLEGIEFLKEPPGVLGPRMAGLFDTISEFASHLYLPPCLATSMTMRTTAHLVLVLLDYLPATRPPLVTREVARYRESVRAFHRSLRHIERLAQPDHEDAHRRAHEVCGDLLDLVAALYHALGWTTGVVYEVTAQEGREKGGV